MGDLDTLIVQDPRNEQEAMAAGRVLLATHDGYPGALRPLRQPAQAGFEPPALRHLSAEHIPFLIVDPAPVKPPPTLDSDSEVECAGVEKGFAMKLTKVHITNFQSVRDSNEFNFGSVTCLVGKNEAGKTAILKALYKLSPITTSDGKFDPTDDYPRSLLSQYEEDVENGKPHDIAVKANFELGTEETEAIKADFGPNCLDPDTSELVLSKDYGNTLWYRVSGLDESAAVQWLTEADHLPQSVRTGLEGSTAVAEVLERLDDESEIPQGSQTWLQLLRSINESGFNKYIYQEYIRDKIPKFLYFDEYYQLTGQENIDALEQRIQSETLVDSDYPLIGLIRLAGLNLSQLADPGRTEALLARLEAAESTLTSQVLQYWSQNQHLRMKFDVRPGQPNDPEGMQSGMNILGRVHDSRHMMTTPLGTRSRGFVWFFSFLAWYSFQRRQKDAESLILLLDEPGLSLHAKAQADLLRYFEKELAPNHQVVYTTHSPFMIDPKQFNRVRIVQDSGIEAGTDNLPENQEGTKVLTDVLSASSDSLFPLQGALGYEIHQTLFVGPNCLIVEGASDLLYIQAISALLEEKGSSDWVPLSDDWTITPVGGVARVPAFVSLIGAQESLNVATLIDFEKRHEQLLEDLYKKKLIKKRNVFTFADFVQGREADIEDMFEPEFYLDLFRQEFRKTIDINALDPGHRIVKRIERFLDGAPPANSETKRFNHYRPARYFAVQASEMSVDEATLARFSDAFRALNALLSR